MRKRELNRMVQAIEQMTWAQRGQLIDRLKGQQAGHEACGIIEERVQALLMCPHCSDWHVVRNGQARGLQRYKCRGCARTFNALTGTPLARLRYKDKWLGQAQALCEGLSITKAAGQLQVARSTAFRWRHRFLKLPQAIKARSLAGIAEADETCVLKSCKGQRVQLSKIGREARHRGGRATRRGLSCEQAVILVARDRSGATTDQIVEALDTAHLAAVLGPLLAADAVLCTDGSGGLGAAARHLGIEHHAINVSAGQHVAGPWHIQNVNSYHSRLKNWMRRFNGVATSYLANYLGWFRALDRFSQTGPKPATLLALAIGA